MPEVALVPKHLEHMFSYLQSCCLHTPVWTPADVDRVLCSIWSEYSGQWADSTTPGEYGGWKGGTESESYTVARLRDGRFGLLSESEDYTGHGCQCSAATNVYATLNDLLRFGVDSESAREAIRQRLAVQGAVVTDSGELESGSAR